jgi:hypothetical protein
MNGCSRHSRIVEVIIDEVNLLLAVDENQGTNRRHADQKVIDRAHLLVPINPNDLRVSLCVSIELEPHKSPIISVIYIHPAQRCGANCRLGQRGAAHGLGWGISLQAPGTPCWRSQRTSSSGGHRPRSHLSQVSNTETQKRRNAETRKGEVKSVPWQTLSITCLLQTLSS